MRTRSAALTAAAATGGLLALAVAPGAALAADAQVRVVHGIPGLPVDVYVDGERTLDDFQPGTVAGPLALPAGDYQIDITAADAEDASEPALSGTASVPDGGTVSLVAHLSEGGEPTLTPFVDDVSELDAGQARLAVRHTAAAPAVDVLAGGEAVVSGLTNPDEEVLELPAGTVSAAVAAAGTTDPLIGPADLPLEAGVLTNVYAIGSLDDGTLDLVVSAVPAGHSAPSGVPAGTEGLAAADGSSSVLLIGAGLGLVAAAAGGTVWARGRTDG